jgi:arsenical pump membrane protein
MISHSVIIWTVSLAAIAGILIRPFRWPEAIWAVTGALLLFLFGLVSLHDVGAGIGKGNDVYLFLLGMMLLAEVAREERLFDWLAAQAAAHARGSAPRLFLLVYGVGILVTTFLSNDATAVVLTPAVAAVVRAARVDKPLPYLLICAFVANAASFVLPISNPANLVLYGSAMPPLLQWLPRYLLPSLSAIALTWFLLYLTQRRYLHDRLANNITIPRLPPAARIAAIGIAITAIVLLVSSALGIQLGLPTAITGIGTSALVLLRSKKGPRIILRGISWSVLPLVAGLFVIVEALNKTGLIDTFSNFLRHTAEHSIAQATWTGGVGIAVASNCMNNLPCGLIAAEAVRTAHVPEIVRSAILIGVDLGPNLSVTGSLATILWLVALRREGQSIGAWKFLKLGLVVMTPALLAAIAALWL